MAARGDSEGYSQKDVTERVKELREAELLQFIRETVVQLNALGDRLESYATDQMEPQVSPRDDC
jgi:hypothetical protein